MLDGGMDGCEGGRNEWTDRRMDKWNRECVGGREGWMDVREGGMNRRMDKWNRQIDGQMDRWAVRTLEGEGTSSGLTPL